MFLYSSLTVCGTHSVLIDIFLNFPNARFLLSLNNSVISLRKIYQWRLENKSGETQITNLLFSNFVIILACKYSEENTNRLTKIQID